MVVPAAVSQLLGIARADRWAAQYLPGMIRGGVSATDAWKRITGVPGSKAIPLHRFRTMFGVVGKATGQWDSLETTKPWLRPTTGYRPVSGEMATRYRSVVRVNVVDPETGEEWSDVVTLQHNDLMSPRKARRIIQGMYDDATERRGPQYAAIVQDATFLEGFQSFKIGVGLV